MLGIVFLWIAAYGSGMLLCKVLGEKETSQMWKHLIGFFFLIFCQGCVFFGGQLLDWNFQKAGDVLLVIYVFVCLLSFLICKKEWRQALSRAKGFFLKNGEHKRYQALFFWLFLGIILAVLSAADSSRKDAVLETVQTTLMTDTMNQYHPFTREPLQLGVILSRKVITLPFWYALVSLWTGLKPLVVVRVLGTLLTISCSLLAFGELARLLFFKNFRKTWLLLVLMELLLLSGDYSEMASGYGLLFYGYTGEGIVAAVILPSMICMLYRFCGGFFREDFSKEKDGIRIPALVGQAGLCMGCCLFLTSSVWGVVMVLTAVVIGILSVIAAFIINRRQKGR